MFYYEGVNIPSATQIQYVGNWHVDNEAGGIIAITPPIKEVCEGDALANFTFQDASTFACVLIHPCIIPMSLNVMFSLFMALPPVVQHPVSQFKY